MLSAASLESKSISRTGRSRPLGPVVLLAIYQKFKFPLNESTAADEELVAVKRREP